MFVIRLSFLVSVLLSIKFMMVEYIQENTDPVIYKSLEKFYDIYLRRGFTVILLLMDREFECLCDNMPGYSDLNTTLTKYHMEDIEWKIWVIKEWARMIWSNFLFTGVPGRIII